MPRGKYDRKESKIKRLEHELAQKAEALRTVEEELAKKDVELRAAKKIADVTTRLPAAPEVVPAEKFTILRENLRTLSEARRQLVDSDQVSPEVLGKLDGEITAHVYLLATLRQDTFKVEQAAPEQQTVPLPATVPPFFQSARPPIRRAG